MRHGTCVTQVPWCISGSLTRGGGDNVPGISGACATHNFTYLIRGPTRQMLVLFRAISPTGRVRLCNWFYLWRLGPRRNHLAPVWWSTFRFWLFKNICWYVILLFAIFYLFIILVCFYIIQVLPIIFRLSIFYSARSSFYIKYFV